MKMVTFTQDMRPYHRGQSAPLPDDIARQMVEEGAAENPRPWPADAASPATAISAPARRGRPPKYLTKG